MHIIINTYRATIISYLLSSTPLTLAHLNFSFVCLLARSFVSFGLACVDANIPPTFGG